MSSNPANSSWTLPPPSPPPPPSLSPPLNDITSLHNLTETTTTTTTTTISTQDSLSQNLSLSKPGCVTVIFSQMEYLPWNNPDNIVSADTEALARQVKNNALALLFLVGGPVNVLNVLVFYKQGLKDRVNLCLFTLSLADELYLLTAMLLHGEQVVIQFTTKEMFGPMTLFMTNNNIIGFIGFCFISPIMSAVISIERCLCVFHPLKVQMLLRTRTMAVFILVVSAVVLSLFFIVVFRFRFGCVYDPETGFAMTTALEGGPVYLAHKELIDRLDSFVFGVGIPGVVTIIVTTMTIMTIVKLRQIMTWRSETSSTISAREVALTKMLIGNSILFISCMAPVALVRFGWLFFPEVNSGRRNQNIFFAGLWIAEIFTYVNATFNFFVYYTMGSRYRETFWALFGKKVQSEKA